MPRRSGKPDRSGAGGQSDNAEALSNYGAVLIALGRLAEALAVYDKALAINPDLLAPGMGAAPP
jgi:tetratricopeptide (TPR) repeat protein